MSDYDIPERVAKLEDRVGVLEVARDGDAKARIRESDARRNEWAALVGNFEAKLESKVRSIFTSLMEPHRKTLDEQTSQLSDLQAHAKRNEAAQAETIAYRTKRELAEETRRLERLERERLERERQARELHDAKVGKMRAETHSITDGDDIKKQELQLKSRTAILTVVGGVLVAIVSGLVGHFLK